jgi:hypothetical protein
MSYNPVPPVPSLEPPTPPILPLPTTEIREEIKSLEYWLDLSA